MPDCAAGRRITSRNSPPYCYYITDRRQLGEAALIPQVRRAITWGVDFVQIREKDLSDGELWRLCLRAVSLSGDSGCRILVNGRADLALSAGAHGVHLPSTGLSVRDIRSWVPRRFIIGVSAHSLAEARRAASDGADYLLLGPIYATPSKIRFGSPMGLKAFRRICGQIPIPVFGLGGIRPDRVPSVIAAGAVGIAGISLFQKDVVAREIPREALLRLR